MSLRRALLSVTCLGVALSVANVAVAKDDQDPQVGVADKKAEEYNAKGIKLGSFDLFPKIVVKETYNDNIYLEKTGESNDWITDIAPSLNLKSNWNRHALNFKAGANIGLYNDYDDNNYEDFNVSTDGRVDVSDALTVSGDLGFVRGHEDRGGDDVASDAKNPVETATTSAGLKVSYRPNRLGIEATADYDKFKFDDNQTIGGGTTYNGNRDRRVIEGGLKVSYELKKGYEAYLRGTLNDRSYDDALNGGNVDRDSDGYNVQAGIAIDLAQLVRADIAAGYMAQDYSSNALDDASGWSGDIDLRWFVTPITTVRGSLSREVTETTTTNSSAIIASNFGVGVDHEFLRNLRGSLDVKLATSDYEGVTREDDKWTYTAKVDYKLNRNFFAGASVEHVNRDSNDSTNDYDQNVYMIKLGAQF